MKRPSPGLRFRRGPGGMAAAGLALLMGASGVGCGPTGREAPRDSDKRWEESSDRDRRAKKKAQSEKEKLDMRQQIDTLARSFAHQTAAADRDRLDRVEETETVSFPVLSYDGSWGWVLLNGGAASGIRREQRLDIYRGDIWVARIRVADVRDRVSGAWVEELRAGWAPAPGDRALGEQRNR